MSATASPPRLKRDPGIPGLTLKSLVPRDLRMHTGAHDSEAYHYRDNTGLEADAARSGPPPQSSSPPS